MRKKKSFFEGIFGKKEKKKEDEQIEEPIKLPVNIPIEQPVLTPEQCDTLKPPKIVGETLRLQDVVGMFLYNINPSFIESKIEKATASQLKKARTLEMAWVFAIAVILIAGAIAYMFISGQNQCNSCYRDLQNCALQGGKVIVQQATTSTPSGSPLITTGGSSSAIT
jgi:hypothetical protein